tara:strand:- start:875 stop:1792 length:918 start_codon:yes stop_codon:yes gene_type:complete
MTNSLVSVIMNCHNSEKYLEDAINSVINQTYQNWELIFWDNCSSDKSSQIVNSFKDKRIKYYLAKQFSSLGAARNLAISKSKGEYIAFLDCDDLWFPKKIESQLPFFKDKEVGIVISNTIFFGKNIKDKILYKENYPPPQGFVFRKLIEAYYISLETVMLSKKHLSRLDHLFDVRFEVIEEFDLLVRLSYFSKLSYVNKILGKWRIHKESLSFKKNLLFPAETRIFIDKLKDIYSMEKYRKTIDKLMQKVIIDEFIIEWSEGKPSRKYLKKIIFKSKKGFLIFIFSFLFSYKFFKKLKNFMKAKI